MQPQAEARSQNYAAARIPTLLLPRPGVTATQQKFGSPLRRVLLILLLRYIFSLVELRLGSLAMPARYCCHMFIGVRVGGVVGG